MKIIPFNQVEQLPGLIRFRLTLNILEVEELGNTWMCEDMVAALNSRNPEAECFRQSEEIAKPHIVRGNNDSFEEPSRSHSARDPEYNLGRRERGLKVLPPHG